MIILSALTGLSRPFFTGFASLSLVRRGFFIHPILSLQGAQNNVTAR